MPGTRKLGRPSDHRKAMLRGMVTFLLENGKIETTVTRAKEVRAEAEKMITLGKVNTLHTKRQVLSYVTKEDVAKKVFDEIAPKYADTVVTPESTRSVRAAATQLRWLSSSWFDLNKNISPSGFREGIFFMRRNVTSPACKHK